MLTFPGFLFKEANLFLFIYLFSERFCPNLDDPENGERLDRNSLPGDRTTFRCHTGYNLKGAPTLLCRTDGQWRPNQPPICDRKFRFMVSSLQSSKIGSIFTDYPQPFLKRQIIGFFSTQSICRRQIQKCY